MNRLLQGEVGSGKTVVALRAMLQVIDSGRQAVLLAPTEVLAAQHARSLRSVLGPLGNGGELGSLPGAIRITLLTGSMTAGARREALLDIASGQAGIAVGTHALLSEGVFFAGLGLIVIDEQHRFGVEQRNALRNKHPEGNPPHVLVMTATPIPRTVAMTVYGDLDISKLSELPQRAVADLHHRGAGGGTPHLAGSRLAPGARGGRGRAPGVRRLSRRSATTRKAGRASSKGQARKTSKEVDHDDPDGGPDDFDEDDPGNSDEKRPPLAVLDVAESLTDGPLAGLRLAILHGRLPSPEKDTVMTGVRGRADRRAGRHHRHRGRR